MSGMLENALRMAVSMGAIDEETLESLPVMVALIVCNGLKEIPSNIPEDQRRYVIKKTSDRWYLVVTGSGEHDSDAIQVFDIEHELSKFSGVKMVNTILSMKKGENIDMESIKKD